MVIFATAWTREVTVMLLTVMPGQKDALLAPSAKLVSTPVMVTSRVAPCSAAAGATPRHDAGSAVVVVVGATVVVVLASLVVVVGCDVVVVGCSVVVVTGAAVMVNANAAVQATTSLPVVTVTSRAPTGASRAMVIFTTASVVEFTCMLLTVMPVPLKDATVKPAVKFVFRPVIVTSRGDP